MSETVLNSSKLRAEEWLKISPQFRLGHLPTEQSHPLTKNLSNLAHNNLPEAIRTLLDVERTALNILLEKTNQLEKLHIDILKTLKNGNKVFFCGCGATGRLSLSIESLWREIILKNSHHSAEIEERLKKVFGKNVDLNFCADQVVSFMAGADYALVRSIENFEDYPEYGARQLHDLGFKDGDLLVATTEGGETPFVIGATLEASRISKQKPYFLYCNPDEVLVEKLQRCREVIQNPSIIKICFPIGPMAITGSTRLQATTVLMLGAGSALLQILTERTSKDEIQLLLAGLQEKDFLGLAPLIERESHHYKNKNYLVYSTADFPLVVLTDLTERSPTFSLAGFENRVFPEYTSDGKLQLAWAYLLIPETSSALNSWEKALLRSPRCIEWDSFKEKFGLKASLGFDFSPDIRKFRAEAAPLAQHFEYSIKRDHNQIIFSLDNLKHVRPQSASLLVEHLLVKVSLNITSNLVMCRMGRVEGNVMMWVRASNNKLIDRVARYVQLFLERDGLIQHFNYDKIIEYIFACQENLSSDEPIVLKVLEKCRRSVK
jgi:N-acetylmuramic acid 6-phosphate etherase